MTATTAANRVWRDSSTRPQLPPSSAKLLRLLRAPGDALRLSEDEWDRMIRAARSARLLGRLAEVLHACDLYPALPPIVVRLLTGERQRAAFFAQAVRHELHCLHQALAEIDTPVILLKGTAYLMSGLPLATGRVMSDVDIMVPRTYLARLEAALLEHGWMFVKTDPYDQHYYRAWTHELPALRVPGRPFELDVHHAILPIKGRLRPNPALLFAAARAIGNSRWLVLAPADQVLHAAAHALHDGDCWNGLRDLHDLDCLVRGYAAGEPDFFDALVARAQQLDLRRPLAHALHFLQRWFGTPVPAATTAALRFGAFGQASSRLYRACAARTLPPIEPDDDESRTQRLARRALAARALWLRFPPWLLAYHGLRKAQRWIAEWRVERRTAS